MHKQMLCGCGCQGLARSDLQFTNIGGKTAWRCPTHKRLLKGAVQCVIITCPRCGFKFIKTLMGARAVTYCPPCQKAVVKERKSNGKVIKTKDQRNYNRCGSGSGSIWYK